MSIPCAGPEVPPVVRTPDECFEALPDFPFAPSYVTVPWHGGDTGLRMHYIDEGPRDAPVILMVHGEPSWSFLYRKLIPVFAAAGYRAIAPDLVGFGRSDKPTHHWDYSVAAHIDWLDALVRALDLERITLVCQDWGGPVGLGVLARHPQRFSAVVAANTPLHTGAASLAGHLSWAAHASSEQDATVNAGLLDWGRHSQREADFLASVSLHFATARDLPPAVAAAYDAPFPSEWHKAGMRQFPLLIPLTTSDPGAAINRDTWQALEGFENPFLTLFSDSDPTTAGWEAQFRERVPGARDQPHGVLENAGHFWQEDCGEQAATRICDWLATLSTQS